MRQINFAKKFVKSGTKAVSEATATIQLTTSWNGFKMNKKAMSLLKLDVGMRVAMVDVYENDDAGVSVGIPQEERFFVCAANFKDDEGVEQGSKIGEGRGYSYGVLYGNILGQDPNIESISFDELVGKKLMRETKSGSKVSNHTCLMDLVVYGDGEAIEIEEGVERVLYQLVNFRFKEHTDDDAIIDPPEGDDPQD